MFQPRSSKLTDLAAVVRACLGAVVAFLKRTVGALGAAILVVAVLSSPAEANSPTVASFPQPEQTQSLSPEAAYFVHRQSERDSINGWTAAAMVLHGTGS